MKTVHTHKLLITYSSIYHAAFSILFNALPIYSYSIIKFLSQNFVKESLNLLIITFGVKIYLNYFKSSLILFTYTIQSIRAPCNVPVRKHS